MDRRQFIAGGTAFLAWPGRADPNPKGSSGSLKVGMMTDIHHAEKGARNTRFYQDSLQKVTQAVGSLNQEAPAFSVLLGDLIDKDPRGVDAEINELDRLEKVLDGLQHPRHYVLGNHCVHVLNKKEFLAHTKAGQSYRSWDQDGWRFITLDACFREDGTPYGRENFHWQDTWVPEPEQDWLRKCLSHDVEHMLVFCHQRLDEDKAHGIQNRQAIRNLLEASGKVRAVFQGHSHQNDLQVIQGIPYCTLRAVVEQPGLENNSWTLATLHDHGGVSLQGFARQKTYESLLPSP